MFYENTMSAVLSNFDEGFSADQQIAQLRIPPHSIEAESSVLGGLLLDNKSWEQVADLLSEGLFYRYEHRQVFLGISTLINSSRPADVITVYEYLQSIGKAEEIGGLGYLNALAQYVPSASNIRRYAEIVRERAILRKLVTASDEIATNAFNTQGKPVPQILDEAEQKIFQIGEEGSRLKQGFQSMDQLAVILMDRVEQMSNDPNDITGVPSGFVDFDKMNKGFKMEGLKCPKLKRLVGVGPYYRAFSPIASQHSMEVGIDNIFNPSGVNYQTENHVFGLLWLSGWDNLRYFPVILPKDCVVVQGYGYF